MAFFHVFGTRKVLIIQASGIRTLA